VVGVLQYKLSLGVALSKMRWKKIFPIKLMKCHMPMKLLKLKVYLHCMTLMVMLKNWKHRWKKKKKNKKKKRMRKKKTTMMMMMMMMIMTIIMS